MPTLGVLMAGFMAGFMAWFMVVLWGFVVVLWRFTVLLRGFRVLLGRFVMSTRAQVLEQCSSPNARGPVALW